MIHSIRRVQILPISASEAWDFFSKPDNLEKITPGELSFQILSKSEGDIHPGQMISYYVRPLLGIKLFWLTEITHVIPGKMFVDEQRRGPYALWHHAHHFREVPGGVEMIDLVHYELPLGWLGNIMHGLFIRKKLNTIFDFRKVSLEKYFLRRMG